MAMATSATYMGFARPVKADDLRADGKQDEADPQSLPHILGGDSKQNRPSSEHHKKFRTEPDNDDHSPEHDSPVAMDSPPAYPGDVAKVSSPATGRPSSSKGRSLSFSSSKTSTDTQGVRVRTKGDDLKSGFPYHPRLYDLRVRPDDWQRFSDQLTNATRFTRGDYARMWAAAGSVALTGAVLTTTWVGRTVNRSIQEKKVSTGLIETSEGSLGGILQQWNSSYFAPLGLQARLELSDSAMRRPEQKSKIFRRPSLMYSNQEDRKRKNEDRKFVIVVTELANDSSSTGVQELVGDSVRAELPGPENPRCVTSELPGNTLSSPAELSITKEDASRTGDTCGIAELPADVPTELPVGPVENPKPADRL